MLPVASCSHGYSSPARLGVVVADELFQIIQRSARILGVEIEDSGATEIAKRARGTPRVANRLLRRTRDFAQIKADGIITGQVAGDALGMLEGDERGFLFRFLF